MKDSDIGNAIETLRSVTGDWTSPYVTELARQFRDPFRVLISTMLSLRTKDAVTAVASRRLFELAATPAAMLKLTPHEIETAIYPVGFYRIKARNLLSVCRELIEHHAGRVPDEQRARLLKRTTAYKQNPLLRPVKFLYGLGEKLLGKLGWADNIYGVYRKSAER